MLELGHATITKIRLIKNAIPISTTNELYLVAFMKILLVGNGAREHAIAEKIAAEAELYTIMSKKIQR